MDDDCIDFDTLLIGLEYELVDEEEAEMADSTGYGSQRNGNGDYDEMG